MILILDYGLGNLGSIRNMLDHLNLECLISAERKDLEKAEKLILPGVGSFDTAIERIQGTPGLKELLDHKALVEKIPVLGICLGMQLLTNGSEEGQLPGLGWIPAATKRFPANGLKIPHMGWNLVRPTGDHPLTRGFADEIRFYFVHSYYVEVADPAHSLFKCHYGLDFDAAVGRDNIFGVQFHPEKSHRFGKQLLKNFGAL